MAQAITESIAFPRAARLLRCRVSNRYFTGEGWTDDPGKAQAYADEVEAARACVINELREVELVLRDQSSGAELFSTPVR